jgi:hypothetical protein
MSPVRYELDFYIPENNILHSHRREILTSYTKERSISIFKSIVTDDSGSESGSAAAETTDPASLYGGGGVTVSLAIKTL